MEYGANSISTVEMLVVAHEYWLVYLSDCFIANTSFRFLSAEGVGRGIKTERKMWPPTRLKMNLLIHEGK